jgi:hypothetical protein
MEESELIKRKKALIQTITFFDIFDFALTREELCDYMLYKKWTLAELKEFTNHERFIIETHRHVYLKGRAMSIKVRKDKEHQARKLIKKAKKHVKLMQMLPFVRTVALCNNLSFYNAERESDIDLFIITERKRLFFARSIIWLYTQLLGLRRHGDKTKGRFCLTFFVSKDGMNLESIKKENDIYLTFWVRLLRPLIGQDTYKELISQNKWINEYFDYEIDQQKHLLPESKRLKRIQSILEYAYKGSLGDGIEYLLKSWQKKRSEKKAQKLENRDGTIISDNVLKFHNEDMRDRYHLLWNSRYKQFERFLKDPIPSDYDKQFLPQSPRSQTPFSVRSPHSDDKRSETREHYSQREQIQVD